MNGWTNKETWLVVMTLQGAESEGFYRSAVDFMKRYKGRTPYRDFIRYYGLENERTIDGVRFNDRRLIYKELNEAMFDFR